MLDLLIFLYLCELNLKQWPVFASRSFCVYYLKCSFEIDMTMYAEIRSNVIDKLVSLAGKKHGIALLEGGKQQTRYEAGTDFTVMLISRY